MGPIEITILVISILVVLLLFFTLIACHSLKKFNLRIEKKMYAVNVLLAQKYDILLLLAKLFKKYKIKLPTEFEDELSPSMDENLKRLTLTERLTVRAYLMKTSQSIVYYAEQCEDIREDSEYLILKKTLVELDDSYRRASALYNADALGFNYWIHLWCLRPIAKMLHLEDKELLN